LTVFIKADVDQWAEEFRAPFLSQIINILNGTAVPAPTGDSASLRVVAGLHVGDTILIDGSDNRQYTRTLQTITPETHRITWSPALPGGVTAQLNEFVRSAFALSFPKQSAIDAAGNVYTTDTDNNRIVVFDDRGRLLWTLGQYGRVFSNAITGADFDGWDDCSDRSVDPDPCPDDPQQMLGRFFNPDGIDVSPDGSTIVVSDQWNDRIQVFTLNPGGSIHAKGGLLAGPSFDAYAIGTFGATHDLVTAGPGQMYGPSGVSYDPATGRIVVADEQYNNRIQIFTPAGGHAYTATVIGSTGSSLPPNGPVTFLAPEDVEFDRSANPQTAGRIIVADSANNRVVVLDAAGQFICEIGDVATRELRDPRGVTVDDEGRIYIADMRHSQIKVYRPAGPSAYALENAFGAEQTTGPVPGELLFISPTGVAIRNGRLIVTESGGQRLQYLTRSGLTIDSVEVDQAALTVQDPAHDHVHVTVTVRNTGGVDLSNLSLTVAPSYQGTVSPITSSTTVLERAGGADTGRYVFDFTATGAAVDGSGFTHTLTLKLLSAAASAGNVTVTSTLQDFDTGVTVSKPLASAIAFGEIAVGTIRPGRAGIGEQITLTVPVQNVGTGALHDVVTTVSAVSGNNPPPVANNPLPVTPSSASSPADGSPVQLAENGSINVPFIFMAAAVGTVQFRVHVTAKDQADHTVTTSDVLVPGAPGVQVVQDNVKPTVTPMVSPAPYPVSADGLRWHNTFPTLNVVAADNAGGAGVTALNWRMLTTSSQHSSDELGVCTLSGGDVFPSSCTPAGAGSTATLTWTRNMSPMQGTVVIAFWAEDGAGNGVVPPVDQTNCSIVTCVVLNIDVDPPSLQPGIPVFNADNTAVSIPFVTTDDISHVASITSPNTLQLLTPSSGVLVLTAEGATVIGSVVARDYAANSVTYAVPLSGPNKPVLRIDHTPPEAFNRLDPAALGRQCTTTINSLPVSYFCTNKVYGTDSLLPTSVPATAFLPVNVTPTRWGGDEDGDDDDHDWDGGNAELQTYSFSDAYVPPSGPAPIQNPNQITLVEKVRQSGKEARVRVMSVQYRQGTTLQPVIVPDRAIKKYEWSTNKDGSLKSLNQKFELHKGKDRVQVEASYDSKSNVTTIKRLGKQSSRETRPGLVLLRMGTVAGDLRIDY
jgi:sugar lactone lactonase YvrE